MAQACFAGDVSWSAERSCSRYILLSLLFHKRSESNPLPNPALSAGIPLKAPEALVVATSGFSTQLPQARLPARRQLAVQAWKTRFPILQDADAEGSF